MARPSRAKWHESTLPNQRGVGPLKGQAAEPRYGLAPAIDALRFFAKSAMVRSTVDRAIMSYDDN